MTKRNDGLSGSALIEFKLATVWRAKGQLERAISGYREAIHLQPDYVPAHLELGNVLCQQGDLEGAIDVYRRALELNPKEATFGQKLGDLLARRSAHNGVPRHPAQTASADLQATGNGRGHVLLYTDCPGIYGAEQCNHFLMLKLVDAGYRVTCAQSSATHYLINERSQAGIRHLWLENDDIYEDPNTAKAFIDDREAAQVFKIAQPDFIIFGGGCPVSNLTAKQVAARLKIPYLVIVHCVTAAWAKRFAAHLGKLPDVYRQAEAIIAVSQENLALLRKLFRLPETLGQVVYNGRPEKYFAPANPATRRRVRQALDIPAEAVLVFSCGRMEMVKGYQYQLKAIKQLKARAIWPRLYFMWAGMGTLEGQLRAAIAQLETKEHVKFLGQRSDIPDLLDAADIFVLPSQFEGMPLSVTEAMAKGLPVIATAVSGTGEQLGETGKLLPNPVPDPAGTIDGLVSTLEDWACDSTVRRSMGQACKRRAESLFHAEPMVATYSALIERSLAGRAIAAR
jgi:glycosyltransferase involved in cell wall biosynthesis